MVAVSDALPAPVNASSVVPGVPILPSVISTFPSDGALSITCFVVATASINTSSVVAFISTAAAPVNVSLPAVVVKSAVFAPVRVSAPPSDLTVVPVVPVSVVVVAPVNSSATPALLFSTPAPNSTLPVANLKKSFAWPVLNSMF